jgi:hypothetical protein
MGTRSTTKIYQVWKDEKGKKHKDFILCLYKQDDGYVDSWGQELKTFLKKGKFVDGISLADKGLLFNGIGDFALLLVKEFKESSGGLYATNESDTQEYNYKIIYEMDYKNEQGSITISCDEDKSYTEKVKIDLSRADKTGLK